MKPKMIDLFAGVGGMSLGFEMAGFKVVAANEYDKSIADAYKYNHPQTEMIVGDITKLDIKKAFGKYKGQIDVVVGGPPCQGFSQKGQRKTIDDERNFLFRYFVNVVKLVKPKYFVMENVPNILTNENGLFQKDIINSFAAIGYKHLSLGILDAADFGVPQNRRRTVIIGKFHANAPSLPKGKVKSATIWDAISDLAYLNSGEGSDEQNYSTKAQSKYQEIMRKDCPTLWNHKATNHSHVVLERLQLIPPNGGKESLPAKHLTKSIYSGTWTRMKKDGLSVTITTRFDTPSSGEFTHPFLNRAITVREAARIQSFPDSFRFLGAKGSQMKQVGNAVPPLLAKAVANVIKKDMEDIK